MRARKPLGLITGLATTVAATAVVVAGAAPAALAVGPALLPATVTTSTGRGDVGYLYVLGVNLPTGKPGYVNSAGTFTAGAAAPSRPPRPTAAQSFRPVAQP